MKQHLRTILHITPHFAPGQCGVSDYVLRWQEQQEPGVAFGILALNDRFFPGERILPDGLALGADVPVKQKLAKAEAFLERGFDGVVFHYVPLGYQSRGLPYWLKALMRRLHATSRPVIFVLHEIWAGGQGKPFLLRIKGRLQKSLLLHLLKAIPGANLVTTSALTAAMIRKEGFVAANCPVFNNLGTAANVAGLDEAAQKACAEPDLLKVILFGSLPPEGAPQLAGRFLAALQKLKPMPLVVWHAGYGYPEGWWESVEQELKMSLSGMGLQDPPSFSFRAFGPLPAEAINYLMQHCRVGLSTYPIELWSKSGSIAAMLANGLPVVVLGRLSGGSGISPGHLPEGVYCWKQGDESLPGELSRRPSPQPDPFYNRKIAGTLQALSGMGNTHHDIAPFSVVMTVYKSWPQALHCLEILSLHAANDPIAEIIVIHDDPGAPAPEDIGKYKLVKLIENPSNLGYVASVNKGISMAVSDRVMLLDSDAYIQTSLVPAMRLLGGPGGFALSMPDCFHSDGTHTKLFYPAPAWYSLILGQRGEALAHHFLKSPKVVVHSYAWGIYKPAWQALGGLDENFRFIESDIDFCMRLEKHYPGSMVFCPAVVITHDGGSSAFNRNKRVAEWYRCRFHMFRKQYGIRGLSLLKTAVGLRLVAEKWMAALLVRLQPQKEGFWLQKKESRAGLLSELANW